MAVNLINSNDIEVEQTGQDIQLKTSTPISTLEGGISENTNNIQNIINGEKYSTTETLTNKVWIDGKPIYRKVIYIPNLPNNTNTSYDTGITETLEHVFFDLGNSYYSWTNDIDYNFRTNITALNYQKSTNKISITSNTNLSSFWAYMCLEYTKTN